MAHDFAIKKKGTKYEHYFFGYAQGALYRSFGQERHNAGFSGDGAEVTVTRKAAIKGLRNAIHDIDDVQNYPDPTRTKEIREFLAKLETEFSETDTFIIWFS